MTRIRSELNRWKLNQQQRMDTRSLNSKESITLYPATPLKKPKLLEGEWKTDETVKENFIFS